MRNKPDDIELFQTCGIHVPTRTIYIGSESSSDNDAESGIDHAIAKKVIKNLHVLDKANGEEITVIINTPGGETVHGMAIYDAIKACRSPVTIKVYGQASSMGSIILQAGDKRIVSTSSKIMVHYGQISISGEALTVYKWIEDYKRDDRKMEKMFLAKIQEKQPHFTLSRLKRMFANDTVLDPQQAIDLNLADEIEEHV